MSAPARNEPNERPLSALPAPMARLAAFVAILAGGGLGGLIGYQLVRIQCDGDCAVPLGLGTLVGAVVAAGGMAIVSILVLRAIGEWRELERSEREQGRTLRR